jgi:hypothetical protein
MGIISDYIMFLKVRKKWWILPLAFCLVVLGLLMVLTESSSLAPFIYALF